MRMGLVLRSCCLKARVLTGMLALLLTLAYAEDTAIHEDVVQRYEQILERAPVEGPSFDKLLQLYQESEGLEKLDERWTPWSTQPGAKGAIYSLLRGLLADRMGKTEAARKLLQTAAQAQPDDFHGWKALGDFEVRQGKWADAIAALQKGLATPVTGEDRLALYRKLGQAQERNLDVPAALVTWQKMVEEFPKNTFALEAAGGAELDAEQFDEATKTFQKLVDLTEPNSMNRVQALMHLAEVDDRQGKTEAAVHDYEAILPLTAQASWLNRELRAQIEQIYRRQDDLAGLATYYQKWTQDNPKDVEALLLLAGTWNELGKKPEALEVLRKIAALAPDRHEVRQSLAEALVEAKQYDEAITVLTALTADDPTEPRYWVTMGNALWLKTQPPTPESKKTVLDAWAHIAPADSKDVAAILQVADICHDHGLNDEALAGYQRALALTPDASDIREKAVKLLVEMKRPEEGWKLLDQMTDGNLATAANYLKLAALDRQFDRKEAATAAVQKGLALEPGNFDLLSLQWSMLAEAQKWSECVALFDKLSAAAPNAYFTDQLEARQLQALTSAGMFDDAENKLHAKLGADPGLTEGELRLLLRMMVQKADADITKAFDEAHRRFPQSVGLMRIEIDYDRHAGNHEAAVAGLQKLIETVPAQKADWLGEIVRVRREQGNLDEALKMAQQIIATSPASADGYLLYADIALAAGKPDEAVTKLQAAIKLSDKPNEVRQRLARYYFDSGQAGKARTIYDEAFAAAETPQDKLTIVRAMAMAYFQDGQIEELISRFKKEQSSEEGGWRYGLYLSAIDEQMQDYGGARRELAKSLAVRPNDTALLRSLIGLAERENDRGELLRYREMLVTADPTSANQIALANEYALQEKPEDAWRIVQKNLDEVAKDPMAWKDVLNQVTDPAYQTKVKSVLEGAIRTKGDSFEGKFALVQFQMQQGDIEGAKGTLWEIMAQPLPVATMPKAGSTPKTPAPASTINSFYQSPMMQRASQSYVAINEAQQLLSQSQQRNQLQGRGYRSRMYNRMSMLSGAGVTTTLDPAAIRDHSLIYLSLIAVQEQKATEFLKDLEAKLDAWHWSASEKLIAYMLIQAREPLLQGIEQQAASGSPDKDLDQFCYLACQQFLGPNSDPEVRKRGEAAQKILSARLAQDPQFKSYLTMNEIGRLGADTTPEGIAKRKAAVAEYVKTLDRQDPQQLFEVLQLYGEVGDWGEIKKTVDELAAIPLSKWNATTLQQLSYFPAGILQQATTTKETMPKEVLPVVMELLKLGYPATQPNAALPTNGTSLLTMAGGITISTGAYGIYNQNTFPPPNRYFPPNRVGTLEPMYQQLKARDMMPAMYAALDEQEKEFADWRKIYPQLMRIYFQWWDNKHDDSVASVRKLITQDPSDEWRMLLAKMLELDKKYDDAIAALEGISARYGPTYIQAQKQMLHVARLGQKNDAGQKAALRLLALHLPQQEQLQLMDDMQNVGMKDKAAEIMKKQSQGNPAVSSRIAAQQGNNQLMQTLNEAVRHNDQAKAADLARQILNHDPMAPQMGNENYLRTQALAALKKSGQLNDYLQDVVKQLAAAPDSSRLNWLVAEAYANAPDTVEDRQGQSLKYFKKVAELNPKNTALLLQIADRFRQAHQPEATADLYMSILKNDFPNAMNQFGNMQQAFGEANRLPEFVKIITDWTSPPMNPIGGGGPDMYYVLIQVGSQLKQSNHLPEAEQVYRKALTVDTYQSKQDGVTALAQLLMDQGHRDEAAAELEKWVLQKSTPAAPPPIMGFNVPVQNQNNWFQNLSWSSNGIMMSPSIHFLEMADALGLSPKLRQVLKEKAAQNTSKQGGQIDSNQMAGIALAIIGRDASYRTEVEQLLKDVSSVPQGALINANSLLILGQLLEKWPQERPMAMRLTKVVYDGMPASQGYFSVQNFALMQILRLAQASGDHKLAQELLHKRAELVRQQRISNPNQVPLDQVLSLLQALLAEGLLKEATDLIGDVKADPQLANGNSYFSQRFAQMQEQIAFAKGEIEPLTFVYGVAPAGPKLKGKGTEFFWELSSDKGQHQQSFQPETDWRDDILNRPTTCRIEVMGGPDDRNITTKLATYESVGTRAGAAIKIPEGVQVLQAKLIRTKVLSAAPGGTPPPATPTEIDAGHILPVGGPENLLKNPDFAVTKDANGKAEIVGWRGILPAGVAQETGGPLPSGRFQTLEASNGMTGGAEIISDRIALQPGTNYVLTGWMRSSVNLGWRLLDADGKVLTSNQFSGYRSENRWWWGTFTLGAQTGRMGGTRIPPTAAFVEIMLKAGQDFGVAGLSCRPWPTVAPAAK